MKIYKSENKGITLVALVVTIIILLVLAGIVMLSLGGENGLLSNVKLAKEKYSISEAKEKLELNIMNLRIEQESKGEEFTKEDLQKLNNSEIDVRSIDNFPVEIICGKYKFNVDENFIVTYVADEDGTIVTYTTEPEGYTNKDEVKILIVINNEKGIKVVEFPNGDELNCYGKKQVGVDYSVNKNGTFKFKIIDTKNKEIIKDIVIEKIDKLEPKDFTPIISEEKITSITIKANAEDEETDGKSVKSGIARYEYYIKKLTDTNFEKYETTEKEYEINNLEAETEYKIYVIAYDYAGNEKNSNEITGKTTKDYRLDYPILTKNGFVNCIDENGNYYLDKNINCRALKALDVKSFDNDFNTYEETTVTRGYFKIEKECWGNYINIYCETIDTNRSGYGCLLLGRTLENYYNILNDYLYASSGVSDLDLITKSVQLPENSNWGKLDSGTTNIGVKFNVYEVWCSDENLSGNKYTNDNMP